MNDEQALISALLHWFESQNAVPSLAISAMAKVCGALIGGVAKNEDDIQIGLDLFITIVTNSANLAFEAR